MAMVDSERIEFKNSTKIRRWDLYLVLSFGAIDAGHTVKFDQCWLMFRMDYEI